MMRTSIIRAFRPVAQPSRLFSSSTRTMADNFQKREKAEEEVYVRKAEQEKLQALKKKLAAEKGVKPEEVPDEVANEEAKKNQK